MRILLDTHIYLWWLSDSKSLTKKARSIIQDSSEVYVSAASIWEASIKIRLKKLDANTNELIEFISKSGFIELPISTKHISYLEKLEDHHKDPFDRMLLAQSLCEPLKFLTADKMIKKYSDLVELI